MNKRVAVILVNYNMPERTDALCEHVANHVRWPHALFVVDNGSDMVPPSKYTTCRLSPNRQTTGGWLAGLEQARTEGPWLGYLFLITSAEFVPETDPLTPLAEMLLQDETLVGVHPALTRRLVPATGPTSSRWGVKPRQTWHLDNICALYRADWFDGMGGFDPALTYAWGIDLETGWKARRDGKKLMVHDGTRIKKISNIGYNMGRMRMNAAERADFAGQEMRRVLGNKYGPLWWEKMTGEYITFEMALPGEHRQRERISAWY
jgi:hypothetical protein